MSGPLPLEAWSDERLTDIFTGYARELPSTGAPLYGAMCVEIAHDAAVKALVSEARAGQPTPNLLFAAAHLLLLRGARHEVRAYYPNLSDSPLPRDEAFPHFRDFVLAHSDEITHIVRTRLVQTNVLERCGALLPGIASAAAELGAANGPIAVIEIGASAGLNLLWDRYGYDFGGLMWGNPASTVQLSVDLRGDAALPAIPARLSSAWRCGVDLAPVDLTNSDDFWWQRALMFPERIDRQQRLEAARDMMTTDPVRLVAGDANERLPSLIAEAPADVPLVLLASFTLYQFSPEARDHLIEIIAAASQSRPIAMVSIDITNAGDLWGTMHLTVFRGGSPTRRAVANVHPHGAWIEWLPG